MAKLLSVIVPAYYEEGMIERAWTEIGEILAKNAIEYELIFVDDGSKDRTWEKICQISAQDKHIRGLSFSRNFGKEAAMFAGLSAAKGEACVLIDCDLQHPPAKIVEMYRLWEAGFEVVEGVKIDRGEESFIHRKCARLFYRVISKACGVDMQNASDFKLLDRKAVNAILTMKEKNGFFRALSSWVGFKTTQIEFEVQKREVGSSKWSAWALVKYALSNISSFSTAPMQIVTILGAVMLLASGVLGVTALYQKIIGVAVDGFTTVILLELFTGSIIMISLGIIGYYIAKIYEEIKDRPRYIVAEVCGDNDEK